jgi:hypothetical protein
LIVKTQSEAWDLINNPDIELLGELLIEDMLLFNYKYRDDSKTHSNNTSVAIASFVTCYARLKLLDELEKIENSSPGSVLYFDTDSIVFVSKQEKYCPPVGMYLGDMTDEITQKYGVGAEMTEFYCTGPKSYCFKVTLPDGTEKTSMKCKGFTQSNDALKFINYTTMKGHAIAAETGSDIIPTEVPQMQFIRDKQHKVYTRYFQKKFRATSDKRKIIGNDTQAFGYKDFT